MWLSGFIFFNVLVVFILFLLPADSPRVIRDFALTSSFALFFFSLYFWVFFNNEILFFQFYEQYSWVSFLNMHFSLGIDGISLYLVVLSTFLIPLCVLVSWRSVDTREKEFYILLFIIELLLILVFSVLDLVLFYIFFEAILIPVFIIIGVWGSRVERVYAAYQFFFYTLFGSLFMLLGIVYILATIGSTDYFVLLSSDFSPHIQLFLWLSFFASFAVKIPMLPMHIWLPQAHVEAPTAGSVLLAGILLKLGGYGFLRFSLPMFPYASTFFSPLVFTLSIIAIMYASFTTIRQVDLKRIIAYSSVAHMNYVTIGIFSESVIGLEGAYFLMLSHGLVSGGLFLVVGLMYERYKTRILAYYSGMAQLTPVFSIIFLSLTFANMSFPGTSGFVGEILIILGAFELNKLLAILAASGTILCAVYSVWLYNRVFFGTPRFVFWKHFSDVNRRELFIALPILFLVLFLGVYPDAILQKAQMSLLKLIFH